MPITYDTGSANTEAANTTTPTTGTITTAEANELLILFYFGADNAAASAFTAATSPNVSSGTSSLVLYHPLLDAWAEVIDNTTTTGADTENAYAHAVKTTAGATGTLQCTANATSRHGMIVGAFKLPAAGTTESLTGSTATASTGSTTPSIECAQNGTQVTSSVGTLTSKIENAIAGSAISSNAGTLLAALSVAATGSQVTTSVGVFTVAIANAITGSQVGASAGTPKSAIDYALSGSAVATYAGTIVASSVAARYARPASDVSNSGWAASTGSDLYAMLDEVTSDTGDYIHAETAGAIAEVKLNAVQDPGTSNNHTIRYVISSANGNTINLKLKQGASTLDTWSETSVPATPTLYERSLSGAVIDSITDYGDVRIEMEAAV
jgi:hypothetical protein